MCNQYLGGQGIRVMATAILLAAYSYGLTTSASAQNPAAQAQESQRPPAPEVQAPPPQPNDPAAPAASETISEAQIEQLVAPIALYPDDLLAQILTASTYPLEVVMAARWAKDNPDVKGDALESAMQKQPWDPSVKGLASVPQVLDMMSEQLDWTQQLGEAFLAQPDDVGNSIQKLRALADASGNLKSSKELKVTRSAPPPGAGSGETYGPYIAIEPAEPDIVYVPVYDPYVVYGSWQYPAYRPFYWRPRGYAYSGVFGFGAAFVIQSALWSRYDWRHRRVYIDVRRYNRFNRARLGPGATQWRYNPRHRGSVPYRNTNLRRQYAKPGAAVTPRGAVNVRRPGAPNATINPKQTAVPRTVAKPNAAVSPRATVKPNANRAGNPRGNGAPKAKAKPKASAAPKATLRAAPKATPKATPRATPRAPRVAPKAAAAPRPKAVHAPQAKAAAAKKKKNNP